MSCSNTIKAIEWPKFTGCDGKFWSNEFLQFHIDKAVDEENYEWAKECKDELDRRYLLNTNPETKTAMP